MGNVPSEYASSADEEDSSDQNGPNESEPGKAFVIKYNRKKGRLIREKYRHIASGFSTP